MAPKSQGSFTNLVSFLLATSLCSTVPVADLNLMESTVVLHFSNALVIERVVFVYILTYHIHENVVADNEVFPQCS